MSFLSAQIIFVMNGSVPFIHVNNITVFFNIFVSLVTIGTIFCMPLRDIKLPNSGISPAFDNPTHQLRSPEDNLTLWQFMTVSWMSPLISLGSARQLNDEDVWSLSLEFQHRLLHDKFRELKGSVVRRLIAANGLDLILIAIISMVESSASRSCYQSKTEQANVNFKIRLRRPSVTTETPTINGRP